jgi:hypothetical protein
MTADGIAKALGGGLMLASEGLPCFPCARSKPPKSPRRFFDAAADPIGIDLLDLERKHRQDGVVDRAQRPPG